MSKVTWRDVDNTLLGGAVQGIGGIGGGLARTGAEIVQARAVQVVTGAMYGFGTEEQRTAAMVSKYRPTTKGQPVPRQPVQRRVELPADAHVNHNSRSAYEKTLIAMCVEGAAVELELRDGSVVEGIVTTVENTGLWIDDSEWVEGMDVVAASAEPIVWSVYSGDERTDVPLQWR